MRLALRILPLLVLLTLVTAVATHHARPNAWSAAPLAIGEPRPLDELPSRGDVVALAGIVRGPDGTPQNEAIVVVEEREPRWAYTDSGGRFRVDGVSPGPLRVTVWAREHEASSFDVVAPAEDLELSLERSLVALPVLPPLPTADLAGTVVAPLSGRGVAGYEVLLLPARDLTDFGAPVPRRATVNADRSFRFDALILGDYRVVVLPPWAAGSDWPNLCAPTSRRLTHAGATTAKGTELALAAGEIRGTVTDLAGRFLEGALCLVAVDALPERVWPSAITAPDGSFLIRDLPPEVYRLEVRAGSGRISQAIEVPPGATVEADLPPVDPTAR